jgi:serine/threonine protein kinase
MKYKEFKTAFDTYKNIGKIGEGGAGSVYKVENEENIIYALKVLDKLKGKLKRFKNELNFHLINENPNIVKAVSHGFIEQSNSEKIPFYVMDFYPGTLRNLMEIKIQPDEVLYYYFQIIEGIKYAHDKKIWHRDLKPENILCDSKRKILAISDFGIAHFNSDFEITHVQTKKDDKLANFKYAAPEQREKNGDIDHRADIFALGLILNEMFTKQIPSGANYIKIKNVNPDYSFLDDIVEKMISQSPNERYNSIEEIEIHIKRRLRENKKIKEISNLNKQKKSATEIDDPLIKDPIKIIDVDFPEFTESYSNRSVEALVFYLNKQPNDDWQNTYNSVDLADYFLQKGKPKINFFSNRAYIEIEDINNAQATTDFFKYVIGEMNKIYKTTKEKEFENREKTRKLELEARIKGYEKKKAILENLKY